MNEETKTALQTLNKILGEEALLMHAAGNVQFDMETLCPSKGMEEAGEVISYLTNQIFKLRKKPEFIQAAEILYSRRDELDEFDRTLAESLHRDWLMTRNISPEQDLEFSRVLNKGYADWIAAREKCDYASFAPSLFAIRDAEVRKIELMDERKPLLYDNLLDRYERGMTVEKLDEVFGKIKDRLIPLLRKITAAKKEVRTDFLFRPVSDAAQEEMARYLLELIGFDFQRGALSTTEHPFTDSMGPDDERVTTHYRGNLSSSMYSIIHEGGHGLFDQNQPRENWQHHITGEKTMGQHESVSRFYENVIGRSESFIRHIFPKAREIFPEALRDVSWREFYEAVNLVEPSLIRTEADEFTYTFHVIIRYELEKALIAGEVTAEELPAMWSEKYKAYLGVAPANDNEGILQDVHWASGLMGYFPAYALGNMYNAMYCSRMKEDFDVDAAIASGDLLKIKDWMTAHVFAKADRLAPTDWIREICGREFTPDDYLSYLEEKYSGIYGI
ncbi:MAG: carboxypeptidase M32 [Lachnospiraceae bacterium]|nr:carboxypeptidase M32 [Lachnospiraceae bacterium]